MLAAYIQDSSFPPAGIAPLRDTQLAALTLPNTALVTATDLGDPGTAAGPGGYSRLHSVHPRNKKPLGARLAASAMDVLYRGLGGAAAAKDFVSPRYMQAHQLPTVRHNASSFEVRVQITFEALPASCLPLRLLANGEATSADPRSLSSTCPVAAGVPLSACAGFEIQTASANGRDAWQTASASVESNLSGGTVVLTTFTNNKASAVARATRFGYGPWPVNTVVTAGDVPLFPWGARAVV
eukprot:SAG22_NODE_49_length_24620_cov_80.053587_3_plen_240_part_00